MENKDALMPYCGVHYLNCIFLCALLHLCVVVYALFGWFGEYDPRNEFLLVLPPSQKVC